MSVDQFIILEFFGLNFRSRVDGRRQSGDTQPIGWRRRLLLTIIKLQGHPILGNKITSIRWRR